MEIHEPTIPSAERNRFLLSRTVLSNDASVDVALPNGWRYYEIELVDIKAQTNDTILQFKFSHDGGVTFPDDNQHNWAVTKKKMATASVHDGNQIVNQVSLHGDAAGDGLPDSGTALAGYSGLIRIFDPKDTTRRTTLTFEGGYVDEGGDEWVILGSAQCVIAGGSDGHFDAIRFLMSSGNLVSGIIKAYGVEL
jgi:hypothetical protein